ncbi:hypothetical protein CCACVL1_02398 [Corchorus capsularis]|uniref:Uncharacterized protein n=1 Tax=Corchorus capsularis TaxID=210143 RepID=A0A1R3K8T8_COCAP|nr:hypothetical protein CCACVL1_02398 [Corchorus capsularis]
MGRRRRRQETGCSNKVKKEMRGVRLGADVGKGKKGSL